VCSSDLGKNASKRDSSRHTRQIESVHHRLRTNA
jgi:hypothetical protein